MVDDDPVLPPLSVLKDRLSRNQRERDQLRTLFRLVLRTSGERADRKLPTPRYEADGRGVEP